MRAHRVTAAGAMDSVSSRPAHPRTPGRSGRLSAARSNAVSGGLWRDWHGQDTRGAEIPARQTALASTRGSAEHEFLSFSVDHRRNPFPSGGNFPRAANHPECGSLSRRRLTDSAGLFGNGGSQSGPHDLPAIGESLLRAELPAWENDEAFEQLLLSLESILPLRRSSELRDPKVHQRRNSGKSRACSTQREAWKRNSGFWTALCCILLSDVK
jgi:hypothetical protein